MKLVGLHVSIAIGLLVGTAGAAIASDVLVSDNGVSVTASDIEHYANLRVPAGKSRGFWGDEDAIRQAAANLFVARRVAYEMREDGLDEQEVWAEQHLGDRGLLVLKLRRVGNEALERVSLDALAKEYYLANPEQFTVPEQVRVSHILIDSEGRSEGEAKAVASELMRKLGDGSESFETLAKSYSDDEGSAKNGGSLDFFSRGQMEGAFETASFALKKEGELAGPVKTRYGFHIIRLEERREQSKQAFEVVRGRLNEKMRDKVMNRAKEGYLEKIRSAEDISSDHEAFASLVRQLPDPKKAKEQGAASSIAE